MYGKGISKEGDILDLGVKHEVVDKSGAWFSYNGERLGQGRDNSKQYFMEHPKLMAEVRKKVCDIKGLSFGSADPAASKKALEEQASKANAVPKPPSKKKGRY